MRRAITLTCTTAAFVVGGAAAAAAAPPVREVVPLDCGDGQVFSVEVNGNGAFTPGRIVGSTGVLIPTGFEFDFAATSPSGVTLYEDTEVLAKGGGSAGRQPTVSCSFSAPGETLTEAVEIEPGIVLPAGTTLTFSGTVTGFITGRR